MRRRRSRPAGHQHQARQGELFGRPRATIELPPWRMLPEETRQAATRLMARLLLGQGRVDRHPSRAEAADDL
jgi:hypothetical protein